MLPPCTHHSLQAAVHRGDGPGESLHLLQHRAQQLLVRGRGCMFRHHWHHWLDTAAIRGDRCHAVRGSVVSCLLARWKSTSRLARKNQKPVPSPRKSAELFGTPRSDSSRGARPLGAKRRDETRAPVLRKSPCEHATPRRALLRPEAGGAQGGARARLHTAGGVPAAGVARRRGTQRAVGVRIGPACALALRAPARLRSLRYAPPPRRRLSASGSRCCTPPRWACASVPACRPLTPAVPVGSRHVRSPPPAGQPAQEAHRVDPRARQ